MHYDLQNIAHGNDGCSGFSPDSLLPTHLNNVQCAMYNVSQLSHLTGQIQFPYTITDFFVPVKPLQQKLKQEHSRNARNAEKGRYRQRKLTDRQRSAGPYGTNVQQCQHQYTEHHRKKGTAERMGTARYFTQNYHHDHHTAENQCPMPARQIQSPQIQCAMYNCFLLYLYENHGSDINQFGMCPNSSLLTPNSSLHTPHSSLLTVRTALTK